MAEKPFIFAITGATGFVGQYVLRAALEAGHTVRALIRPNTPQPDIEDPDLTWVRANIGDQSEAFLGGADCVIHIAGVVKAQKREDYYAVNAGLAGKLAIAADQCDVDRFVLISSMAARAPNLSDYAGSKRAGEVAVKDCFPGKIAIIRAPAVFGPGDKATAPIFAMIKKGRLPAPGGKNWKNRFISLAYVEDLAKDIVRAAAMGVYDGDIVSPATKPRITWPEFARECSEAAGFTVKAQPIPVSLLHSVAAVTSATSRLFGLGHLTLGKLNEFLYDDWSSEELIHGATPLRQALKETLSAETE